MPANNNWEGLGGSAATTPVAVSWGLNRIDLVVGTMAQQVGHLAYAGAWSWDLIGGLPGGVAPSGHPTAIAHGTSAGNLSLGTIDVFAQNAAGGLFTTAMTGSGTTPTWSGWTEMDACYRTGSVPALVSRDGVNIDLMLTASNGDSSVWHDSTSGSFANQNAAQPPSCN